MYRVRLDGLNRSVAKHYGFEVSVFSVGAGPQGSDLRIFDTQSTPSGASNPPSDETPAADDQRTEGKSEMPESEATSGQRQSGGETAEESMRWDEMTDQQRRKILEKYAVPWPRPVPTSPPTTPANGQPTKSGPTTTDSAGCSSACGLAITRAMASCGRELQAAILSTTQPMLRLVTLIEHLADCYASTTAAQPTPSKQPTPT